MKNVSFYDKFNENLKVLSSDYYEYTNTFNEFIKSLNLKINDKGGIEALNDVNLLDCKPISNSTSVLNW